MELFRVPSLKDAMFPNGAPFLSRELIVDREHQSILCAIHRAVAALSLKCGGWMEMTGSVSLSS